METSSAADVVLARTPICRVATMTDSGSRFSGRDKRCWSPSVPRVHPTLRESHSPLADHERTHTRQRRRAGGSGPAGRSEHSTRQSFDSVGPQTELGFDLWRRMISPGEERPCSRGGAPEDRRHTAPFPDQASASQRRSSRVYRRCGPGSSTARQASGRRSGSADPSRRSYLGGQSKRSAPQP